MINYKELQHRNDNCFIKYVYKEKLTLNGNCFTIYATIQTARKINIPPPDTLKKDNIIRTLFLISPSSVYKQY